MRVSIHLLFGLLPVFAKALTPPPEEYERLRYLDSWHFDIEMASLWRCSNNTFLDYHLTPLIWSLRSPANLRWEFGQSQCLAIRNRFSLLTEPIWEGPESYYLGMSASPSVEWWWSPRTYFHCGAGGGFGWVDSQNVPGGQGQDFTFNWFAALGVRHYISPQCSVGVGVFFQHFSNRGATDPNPGIDGLGPSLSVSWQF